MKRFFCTLFYAFLSLACLAQGNPGTIMQEPNYYQETNPKALRDAGRQLQKFSKQFYIGLGVVSGGSVISSVGANSNSLEVAAAGVIATIVGAVIQINSYKHIGRAGRTLEYGGLSNIKIQGNPNGPGLGLAYCF